MLTRLMFILALAAGAAGFAVPQDEHWQKFIAPDNSCSINFPVTPDKQEESKDSPAGRVVTNIWLARDNGAVYLLGITDYPVDIDAQRELELDRDNFLKEVNAKLISESETTVSGHRGKEFTGASDSFTFRSRVFVIRRRVYQVAVGEPTNFVNAKATEKFISSLALLDVPINQ
jgi:hypothetical protein